jgi:hypothetical protein
MGQPAAEEAGPVSFSGRVYLSRKNNRATVTGLPPEEARVRAVAEVVNGLIAGVKEGKDVDLNQLKTEVSTAIILNCKGLVQFGVADV